MIDKLITNNPLVQAEFSDLYDVEYYDVSFMELLIKVRDYIHIGHELLTHPLSGSIKPNETPYKSVLISGKMGKLDMKSLFVIEDSIATANKFQIKYPEIPEHVLADFQEIDRTLIAGALSNYRPTVK